MANNRKTTASANGLERLKKANSALRVKVKKLQAERDACVKTIQAWAKSRVTDRQVELWMGEEKVEGSFAEFIDEIEKASRS